jgi:hypothetical protein
MISLVDATRSKIEHALQRVRGLRSPVAAQGDVENALGQIEKALVSHRDNLNALATGTPDPVVLAQHCRVVLGELYMFLSSLGFLHRAQHPCNPFEAYDPLRRLAQQVIGSDTRIVISSEWDFSPLTYVSLHGLPEFVFIGLPASEAENALLLPLAGHEFGHSLWRRNDEGARHVNAVVTELLVHIRARMAEFTLAFPHVTDQSTLASDPTAVSAWRPSWLVAQRQCEEVFCGLVGLRLFGESYLKAFAWLIAPGLDDPRSFYPLAKTRARILANASSSWGIAVPTGYEGQFIAATGKAEILLELADSTCESLAPVLTSAANALLTAAGIDLPRQDCVDDVAARLLHAVPSVLPSTLQELLCAAWRLRDAPALWSSSPHLRRDRERILNEILLKSAQCIEWRTRLEKVA